MMTNERKNELNPVANLISQYMDIIYSDKDFEFYQLEQIILDLMGTTFRLATEKCSKEEKDYIVNKIRENKSFHIGGANYVALDNNRSWFTDDTTRDNSFFERYKRYLQNEKGFSSGTVDELSIKVLNPLMNQLGNPKSDEFSTHGLVMGDVQSGKTMTYIGLINKAVDAGYKLIIILTGTVESLRKQTQERVDIGFTGFDSDSEIAKATKFIGVGLDKLTPKGTRFATSFTTKVEDFNSKLANGICTSLDLVKGPAIMVIKKNVKVLERIYEWLVAQHGVVGDKKLSHPILMIDDEADNASINTKDEDSDPTKTNAGIRKILNIFERYSYVGFTATPFANIFIVPDTYDKKLGKDLFPSDFIFSLTPPDNYIGGKDIFLPESKYKKSVIFNDDCNEVLPSTHKKYHPFNNLPLSLKKAIISFLITNCIRDIRGDVCSHRAMLINISRYTLMHKIIIDVVDEYLNNVISAYYNFAKKCEENNDFIVETKEIFDKEFSKCKVKWLDVKNKLYESNSKVKTLMVNKDADMINYKEYEDTGARVIFVGGLSLSRGLTLEGLVISYFYRFSKTYDVLFQMGRWFGYRKGYEDLFRIYMPQELVGWYSTITESIEELKYDLIRMRDANKKPSDYGIRIQNDSSVLKLTTASKMRSAETAYKTVIGFGEVIPTPDIINDVKTNENNINIVADVLLKICSEEKVEFKRDETTSNLCIKNIPLKYVLDIIENTKMSSANDLYDKESLKSFISNYGNSYFKNWDIAIIEGDKKTDENIYTIPQINLPIHKSMKQFDVVNNYIRMQGSYEQLNNPIDTATCLDKEIVDELEKQYKEAYLKLNPGARWVRARIPSKRYLEFKSRRPLLMLYFIELSDVNATDSTLKVKDKYVECNVPPFAVALGIPRYEDSMTEKTLYKINVVEQRRRRELEYNFHYEEEEEDI